MSRATMLHRHQTALAAAIAVACLGSHHADAQAPAQPAKPPAAAPPPRRRRLPHHSRHCSASSGWGAYTASPGGKKVCFASPSRRARRPPPEPAARSRLHFHLLPSRRKVRDESRSSSATAEPNADASIEISGAAYAMYTQADGAWVKNAAEETRLVDAMRKGADLTVKGTSAKGTASVDVYSLRGLPEALNRVGQECK